MVTGSNRCGETDKGGIAAQRISVNLKDRMANIDANLDDLQSGVEASSRAADTVFADMAKFNGRVNAPLVRAVVQHVKNQQESARDQRAALTELRDNIWGLQQELTRSKDVVRPPPTIGSRAPRR